MMSKAVDEGTNVCFRFIVLRSNVRFAEAIVVSRYNETRHLRTQAALSKLSANVAQNLEAMCVFMCCDPMRRSRTTHHRSLKSAAF